jgi:hypothetical protein
MDMARSISHRICAGVVRPKRATILGVPPGRIASANDAPPKPQQTNIKQTIVTRHVDCCWSRCEDVIKVSGQPSHATASVGLTTTNRTEVSSWLSLLSAISTPKSPLASSPSSNAGQRHGSTLVRNTRAERPAECSEQSAIFGLQRRLAVAHSRQRLGNSSLPAYAAEELIAELGAAFLAAEFSFNGDVRHAGYIATWITLLRSDKRAFFTAASQAQAAADYFRGLALAEPIAEAA